jgi:hypothetical protein
MLQHMPPIPQLPPPPQLPPVPLDDGGSLLWQWGWFGVALWLAWRLLRQRTIMRFLQNENAQLKGDVASAQASIRQWIRTARAEGWNDDKRKTIAFRKSPPKLPPNE